MQNNQYNNQTPQQQFGVPTSPYQGQQPAVNQNNLQTAKRKKDLKFGFFHVFYNVVMLMLATYMLYAGVSIIVEFSGDISGILFIFAGIFSTISSIFLLLKKKVGHVLGIINSSLHFIYGIVVGVVVFYILFFGGALTLFFGLFIDMSSFGIGLLLFGIIAFSCLVVLFVMNVVSIIYYTKRRRLLK